jgi:hypothetical protein
MAGSAQVMQEYLIKLGFQSDQISLRKFDDALSATGKKVVRVGGAIASTVAAMEAASVAFALKMRKMYFEAELADTTVKNMEGVAFAAKKIGIEGNAMRGTVSALASILRLNPGMQAYAESLTGISVAGRKTDEVMLDLVQSTMKMDEYMGAQIMQSFGMSADVYHQLRNHLDEFKKAAASHGDIYKAYGIDPDAAKKTMLEYTTLIDNVQAKLEVLGMKWLISSAPAFKEISVWLDKILDGLGKIASGEVGLKILDFFDNLSDKIDRASVKTFHPFASPAEQQAMIDERKYGKRPPGSREAGGKITVLPGSEQPERALPGAPAQPKQRSGAMTEREAIAELQEQGWSRHKAVGIVTSLKRESNLNPNARNDEGGGQGAKGIAQWRGSRLEDFKAWAGKDIEESTAKEQLAFLTYEMRHGKEKNNAKNFQQTSNAADAARAFSRDIERHGNKEEDERRARYADKLNTNLGADSSNVVSMSQHTEINVTGNDAPSIGRNVAAQQRDVNAEMVRNLKSPLQ